MTTPHDSAAPANFWARTDKGLTGFRAATVCRNGHEQTVDEDEFPGDDLDFCSYCSERVLGGCPNCGRRLRGASRSITLRPGSSPAPGQAHQWSACDRCGDPYPWADRETKISHLLRSLRQDIPEHDREVIADDLQRLRDVELGEDPETEGRVMSAFKRGAFVSAVAADALGGLISDIVSKQFL
ncbi:DUF2321 domain-containing protein [Actinoplanes sp. LDG1-06]|uniref:DUF2321 domain-containing protein n=1 Tax=Paractinoplanes ovalisporus TaxID=2810368 RepID=A0ABS2AK39_9ACTN|nr:DUF2321 domain-containing protein [Actinoplanes ovalisporus]MBM2620176.1 DUF2321 domain-containing protein [Actinoplanes ovalisporus]